MAILTKPKDIFVEFLRTVYKEPARSGLSKRHTTGSDNVAATAGQTSFVVDTLKLLCVNSVTVDGVAQTKWVDYDVDLRNNRIVFRTGLTLAQAVVISYDYNTSGISWINVANPERDTSDKLSRIDYPRVAVSELDFGGRFMGFNSDKQDSTVVFSIDIAAKDKIKATDYVRIKTNGTTETVTETAMNTDLVDVLSINLSNAIKRNWRAELLGAMYASPNMFKGATEVVIDNDSGIFRRVIDVEMKGFDLGERS